MTILDALDDPNLLGAAFPDPTSWARWRVFLAAVFGLPLETETLVVFTEHTGRETPPAGPASEVWTIVGRCHVL